MPEAQRITHLAEAVADGRTPDWHSEELSSADAAERGLISMLKAVQSIHGLYTTQSDSRRQDAGRTQLSLGDTWGGLEMREHVGRGRFGDVYRAWDPALDREVALKLLRHSGRDERAESRVVDEGRLMARIRHPNVVTIHGAQRIDGVSGLWMEFVEGRTLACELAARGPFGAEELTRTGIELGRALAAVHRAGLVHRDVKAQNVLRDATGRIVLGDFGTGRELDEPGELSGGLAGTPAYLAPEIFDRQPATAQSDIYSLGALLFYLATRRFPVEGRSLREIRDAHTRGDRTSLASLRGDLPPALSAAVDSALHREPSRRFASAEAITSALEGCLSPVPAPQRRRVSAWVVAGILASAVAASVGWVAFGTPPVAPVPFAARDFVLVTPFENRTGEPLLDGTLEHALERAFSDSLFVNVVPRGRVEDVLRLMRMAPGTPMTVPVGLEVAARDGRIRLVIAGRVEKIGGRYALRVAILRPQDGAILGNVQEPSVRQEDLLQAVHRISIDVRQRVGETLPPVDSSMLLPNVTTQSLRALQLYSRVVGMETDEGLTAKLPAAEHLLRDAIREDPSFVAAHMKLSIVLRLQNQLQASLQAIERAVQLSPTATEFERLVATGELHGVRAFLTADSNAKRALFERAAASYEAALHLKPDDHQALVCLTNVYSIHLGRPNLDIATRLADLRPHSAVWQGRVVMDSLRAGNVELARRYAARPTTVDGSAANLATAGWLKLYSAHEAWLQNRPREAMASADAVASELAQLSPQLASEIANQLSFLYITLGALSRAEAVAELITEDRRRKFVTVRVASERQNPGELRKILERDYADIRDAAAVAPALVDAGLLNRTRDALNVLASRNATVFATSVEGQLALAEGRTGEAVTLLRRYIAMAPHATHNGRRHAEVKLAAALARRGQISEAIATLQKASEDRRELVAAGTNHGYAWLAVRDQLAQLYRRAGRTADAVAVDAELLTFLEVADGDHPIKRRLTNRDRSAY